MSTLRVKAHNCFIVTQFENKIILYRKYKQYSWVGFVERPNNIPAQCIIITCIVITFSYESWTIPIVLKFFIICPHDETKET